MNRQMISNLIDGLQSPDEITRDVSMEELILMGSPALDVILANLAFSKPKVKTLLMRVIGEIGDPKICIDLMRFVFDNRKKSETHDARGVAMQNLVSLSLETDKDRMFQFAMELMSDEDLFVRAGAIQLLGKFGDSRVVGILEDQLKEATPFVLEAANLALAKVRRIEPPDTQGQFDDARILQEIRNAQGGERDFFIAELRRRDNAFELARSLVLSKERGVVVGLHVMQSLDDPRVRDVAFEVLSATQKKGASESSVPDSSTIAIALRLLATNMAGKASDTECELIRKNMVNADTFIRIAATLAASTTGNDNLVGHAIRQLGTLESPETTKQIAKGISETLPEKSRWIIPHAIDALDQVLKKEPDLRNQNKLTVAYLLRVLKHATTENSLGSKDAESAVFRALKYANGFPQIVIASIELLEKTAPQDGHKLSKRWSEDETLLVADLLNVVPENLVTKTLRLLHLGACPGVERLTDLLRPLAFGTSDDVSNYVIPLLAETHSSVADDIIKQLAEDANPAIKNAAVAAQRRNRNAKDWIDAQFE